MEFGEGLFDDFAEVASFAGVDHDLAGLGHCASLARVGGIVLVGVGEGLKRRWWRVDVLRARSIRGLSSAQDDGEVRGTIRLCV
jgi:hypothetical protein